MVGRAPKGVVEGAKEMARLLVPAPPEVNGQLTQAGDSFGQGRQVLVAVHRRIVDWDHASGSHGGRRARRGDRRGAVRSVCRGTIRPSRRRQAGLCRAGGRRHAADSGARQRRRLAHLGLSAPVLRPDAPHHRLQPALPSSQCAAGWQLAVLARATGRRSVGPHPRGGVRSRRSGRVILRRRRGVAGRSRSPGAGAPPRARRAGRVLVAARRFTRSARGRGAGHRQAPVARR